MASLMTSDASHVLLLIFGAAALLLWGTRMARTGVTRAFGAEIRRILSSGLRNRLVAAGSGVFAAAVLQSSTAVALFLTSFARMGTIAVPTGLAVMLGADVGSAVVAALLTLDIKQFWPLCIALGYVVHTVYDGRSAKGKQFGRVLLGLGLILLALGTLGLVADSLSESRVVRLMLASMGDQHVLAIVLLALLTWLAHSSIAVLLLVASLVAADVVADPQLVVAMVLGINLGGGIPAIALTWAEAPEARRIAVGNGLFRLAGVAIGVALLPRIAALFAALPLEPAFATVMLHIGFNLALLLVCLLLVYPAAALLSRLLPAPQTAEEGFGPRYVVSDATAELPSLALSSLMRETLRMIDIVEDMLGRSLTILETGERGERGAIHDLDDRLDTLYEAIKSYATDLTREDIEIDESRRAVDIISFATSLENAGDIIEKSLLDIVDKKIKSNTQFSAEGAREIGDLFAYVAATIRMSASATMTWDRAGAERLLARKRAFKAKVNDSAVQHLERLRNADPRAIETSSFHLDLIGDLQRVNSLVSSISYAVIGASARAPSGAAHTLRATTE